MPRLRKPDCDPTVMHCGRSSLRSLVDKTGIDIGYHVCGAIEVCSDETQYEFQQTRQTMAGRRNSRRTIVRHAKSGGYVADLDDRFEECRLSAGFRPGAKPTLPAGAESRHVCNVALRFWNMFTHWISAESE